MHYGVNKTQQLHITVNLNHVLLINGVCCTQEQEVLTISSCCPRGKLVQYRGLLLLCPHGAAGEKTEMLHGIGRQIGLGEKILKNHICTAQGWLFFEKTE